jgi:hypothetical protein
MSQDQLTIVLLVFGVVIVLSVLMLVWAVAVRRKRTSLRGEGPGSPRTQLPADPRERFGPALAAVYARSEWHRTRGAKRELTPEQTYFGYGCVLPLPILRSSLARDWSARAPEQARERIGLALETLAVRVEEIDRVDGRENGNGGADDALPSLAFDIARFANLVRWCGSAGFISHAEARSASENLGSVAVIAFDSWDAFGENYLIGLRQYSRRGNRPFEQAVDGLLAEPTSPWRALAWPGKA